MQVLVTGAGGQLGREWVEYCSLRSISFEAFDSKNLDITDPKKLERILAEVNPDILINCAAYTKVDQAENEPEKAERINSIAVKSLAEICKKLNIKLVHYSTDYVFSGAVEDLEKFPDGYPENYKTNPQNVYGQTKRDGELHVLNSGCDCLIIRVSWLCGKHGNNFVKTMIRLGIEKSELSIVNDQFGSPTFTEQVVVQTYELLKSKEQGVFHLSSLGMTSWFEFAKEIFNLKSISIDATPVDSSLFPAKATRPSFSKLSTKKISTIPAVKLYTWQQGLKRLISQID